MNSWVFFIGFWLCCIVVVALFLHHYCRECRELQRREDEEAQKSYEKEKEFWLRYSSQLADWFASRRSGPFNREKEGEIRILYTLAQHTDQPLASWEIRLAWGWDGSNIDKLRFEKSFDELQSRHLLWGYLDECNMDPDFRRFYLTDRGRDYLIKRKVI